MHDRGVGEWATTDVCEPQATPQPAGKVGTDIAQNNPPRDTAKATPVSHSGIDTQVSHSVNVVRQAKNCQDLWMRSGLPAGRRRDLSLQ